MDLVFPFKNLVLNGFFKYFEKYKVKEFSDLKHNKRVASDEYYWNDIQMWRDLLPNFENEILQLTKTSDQATIDYYFEFLEVRISQIKIALVEKYYIDIIYKWNIEILKEYEVEVEKKGEQYSKQEARKMKHLEEYEIYDIPFFGIFSTENKYPKKVKHINHNFYCIEEMPDLIEDDIVSEYLEIVKSMFEDLNAVASKYVDKWEKGELKSEVEQRFMPPPILFVEGEHDITYIKTAANFLGKKELIEKIEIRQRGGSSNLDKLWSVLIQESWEIIPQIKILLYDCDTKISNEDFPPNFKRIIPSIDDSIIKTGIENLIPTKTVERALKEKNAFVDFKKTEGTRRGVEYKEEYNVVNM